MWSCVQKWKGGIGKRGKRGEEGRKFDSRILIGLSFKHLDSRIWFFKSIIKINLVYLIKVSFRLVLKKKNLNWFKTLRFEKYKLPPLSVHLLRFGKCGRA